MKLGVLAILILGVIAGLVYLGLRGTSDAGAAIEQLEANLVEDYCRAVAEGRFRDAYALLTRGYREEVNLADFSAGHEKRRSELGPLRERVRLRMSSSTNLFTGHTEHRVLYELTYPTGTREGWVILNDADGEFRIEGTYSRSLNFELW